MVRDYKIVDGFNLDKDYNYFISVETLKNEFNLKEEQFYEMLPINSLSEFFGLDKKEVIKEIQSMIGKKFGLRDLFSYTYREHNDGNVIGENSIKVSNNSMYYVKEFFVKGQTHTKNILCDVYVIPNLYYTSTFNLIFENMFQKKYPSLFDKEKNPFLFHEEKLFTEEQKEKLNKISAETEIKEIHYSLTTFPISLIMECINNKNKINATYLKSNISLYVDCNFVFIHLFNVSLYNKQADKHFSYGRTLYIPIEFFKTKDWSLVENVTKHGDAYEDENSINNIIFIEQKQGDADYFKTDLVQKIKQVLMSC